MREEPTIDQVVVKTYTFPTDQPEADGTLAWSDTTMILVEIRSGAHWGIGYTYAGAACKTLIDGVLAGAISGRPVMDVNGAWEAMVRQIRNLGRPGVVSCAISAVDTALWDLKGKLLDTPVCRLLGVVHPDVPVYGSGGFTTYDERATREQLAQWVGEWQLPRVKIKIGQSWGNDVARDLSRIALCREVIGPDVELFVDANGGYTRKQAIRVGEQMAQCDVRWFEEPVSSDDLVGLKEVRDQLLVDVTAGEYGFDLVYFARMVAAQAVDCLQVDVTRCGGITEWVRVAAVAAAAGLSVSGHCAPNLHAHVAASVPNLAHLEYFHDHVRIEDLVFAGALSPQGGAMHPDQEKPGLGLELKESDAQPYRVG
ncbi:enolase C-terminal domain-like protein [Leekyejoonella antrihumi]|uniref:Mandelate racemase n=1 Tax=Leekyejoonella antrihumi TaxID=1660198 RepID=A0A563DU91_9MICO|nr:enolase C-terminal domain-like protein [Leekyejoonella antrihumi]TWP33827.1 mandelate racemase [Leekyejoonella antrihumi]